MDVKVLVRDVMFAKGSADLSDDASSLRLSPLAWGAVTSGTLDDTAVRTQRLVFGLDAEVVDPVLTTGGGVITRVAVTGAFAPVQSGQAPEPFEPFDVTRGVPT